MSASGYRRRTYLERPAAPESAHPNRILVPMHRTVAAAGLGKIGLPLAAQFPSKSWRVIGRDVLPEVVEAVSAGRGHGHEAGGREDAVARSVGTGSLSATLETAGEATSSSGVAEIGTL